MSYRMTRPKAIGLCLFTALFALALNTAAANATWKVNGTSIGGELTPKILGHNLSNVLILLTTMFAKVEVHCELLQVSGKIENPLHMHAAFTFSKNCKTLINSNEFISCKPLPETVLNTLGKLVKHNGMTYILFTPLEGTSLGVFHLGSGPNCPLTLNWPISGSFVMECLVVACNQEAVSHPLSFVLPGLFPSDTLMPVGAGFHGGISLHLGDAHQGMQWSGLG